MRKKQNGTIVRISGRWYLRYWERRNISGTLVRKRASYCLGEVKTRGIRPPPILRRQPRTSCTPSTNASFQPSTT